MSDGAGTIGVDVGGTFTDLVRWDGHSITMGKVPSTPDDQSRGVIEGAASFTGETCRLLHGTTVATNALLERRGAATALVTSSGFEDVIEIGRQDRPALYDSFHDRPEPLVPRRLRLGDDVVAAPTGLASRLDGVGAVAISLLYGYRRGDEEAQLEAAVRAARPDVAVSCSSRVVAEFREYERTATTILNAYLAPETGRYLEALVGGATAAGLPAAIDVMRSSGGLMPVQEAALLPAAILLSGPAAGVVATAALGDALGKETLVSFDMGGTSTDVCRIERGRPEVSYEREVAGFPCRMPAVAIHTVGAGGGSVGWVDDGGSLRVGPRSTGAVPGPACYGLGGVDPAVTDADVVLGRIHPGGVLAGSLPIRDDLAEAVLQRLGDRLGMSAPEAAHGMVAVVEEVMAGAIRSVSIEQGADPRRAGLVAFGGAGGLHATALARRLDMASVLIPPHAGVFSALGLLLSPPRADAARSVASPGPDEIDGAMAAVMEAATARLVASGYAGPIATNGFADVRYRGQSHETTVPYEPGTGWNELVTRFHRLHHQRNGFSRPEDPIEVVTVRGESTGDALLRWESLPPPVAAGDMVVGSRPVLVDGAEVSARVVRREGMTPGAELIGPAVIEEINATTYLGPGERAVVHDSGVVEIEW
jgi:N-methylhydantoinase A